MFPDNGPAKIEFDAADFAMVGMCRMKVEQCEWDQQANDRQAHSKT